MYRNAKESKKNILLMVIAIACTACVVLATPVCIITFIYEWAVNDMVFKAALWSAVKQWICMILMIVPAFCISYFGR